MDPAEPTILLSPKSTSVLGTWNVRTMYQLIFWTIIANEMKYYKISILGLKEIRTSGEMKLTDGTTIIYSGHPEDGAPHTEGVAFTLTPKTHRAQISWEPINSRRTATSFRNNHKRITTVITPLCAHK